MYTHPQADYALLAGAGAAAATALSPYVAQNGLGQLVGSLRRHSRPDLASQVAQIADGLGDRISNTIGAMIVGTRTGTFPPVANTDQFKAAAYNATWAYPVPGLAFALACAIDPAITVANGGEPVIIDRGPDGKYGTGDDVSVVKYVGGPIQPYQHYKQGNWIVWRSKTGPLLSWLQASRLNLEALDQCTEIVGSSQAMALRAEAIDAIDAMTNALNPLKAEIDAIAPFSTETKPSPYLTGGTLITEPIR